MTLQRSIKELQDALLAHLRAGGEGLPMPTGDELAWAERVIALEDEVASLRTTNTRLNRRCGRYEAGLTEAIEASSPGSFGRALANASATKWKAEAERLAGELAKRKGEEP